MDKTVVSPIEGDGRKKFLLEKDDVKAIVYIEPVSENCVRVILTEDESNYGATALESEDFFDLLHSCFGSEGEFAGKSLIQYTFNGYELEMRPDDDYMSSYYNKVYNGEG